MNTDQNLTRARRRARHILEQDYLRASKHVDAIGFHCHRHECVLHEMSIMSGALIKAVNKPSGRSVRRLKSMASSSATKTARRLAGSREKPSISFCQRAVSDERPVRVDTTPMTAPQFLMSNDAVRR